MGSKAAHQTEAMDGNEAAARVAYALSEVVVLYPITPSSPMGESCDAWSAAGKKNLWGSVPEVVEMQSEAGAAGAAHGALTTGAFTTTFTASQGLLLMIPNMYKIAGELTPAVFHVAARSLATSALSIFGDHADVMAARQTGWALLCSSTVQEAHDFAAVAHAATLRSRIPFLHFFDGFRTSHEIQRVSLMGHDDYRALLDGWALRAHRRRSLDPERPVLRGTAMNPDVCFQAREAGNPYYSHCAEAVEVAFARLAERTGRQYGLFDYYGPPDAERVLVLMGSGAGAARLAAAAEPKTGVLVVRLYRPFDWRRFIGALPASTKSIAVLDRTKEPGAPAEPLYLDVVAALEEHAAEGSPRFGGGRPTVIGGRYGLSSKEFTPAMAAAALAELKKRLPKRRFTVGINDDVSRLSLDYDDASLPEDPTATGAVFYGLGSDGTVGANKNSIKIIAEETALNVQAYFVYDSKKSGSMTVSHLRFGPNELLSSDLVRRAQFTACHQESLMTRVDVLERAAEGGVFLLNTANAPAQAFARLPAAVRRGLIERRMRFFVMDAALVAREAGLPGRINIPMQAAFFALAKVVADPASAMKRAIEKTYGRKSEELVRKNSAAVDASLARLSEVPVPGRWEEGDIPAAGLAEGLPPYVQDVALPLLAGRGDALPVSAMPVDGTFPTGTARYEKRGVATEVPVWDERWCIQCNKCAFVCPHAAVRTRAYPAAALEGAPAAFKSVPWRGRELPEGTRYTVQVAPEDCTGCGLCVEACPARNKEETRLKAINMAPMEPLRVPERENFAYFESLPDAPLSAVPNTSVKGSQLRTPLFEFSGACAGCGETPYLKLLTQLFGDRLAVANATGCSSIYGGNLPTTPWAKRPDGRGPAWSNSLFEDAAEFGLGFRLSYDVKERRAKDLLRARAADVGEGLARELLEAAPSDAAGFEAQRERVSRLRSVLGSPQDPELKDLLALADSLVAKSVWVVGGDGWAYDIGYGGLDHVLASGRKINLLVLDTEVYSNTGGQASKATPRAAVAKFAASGKATARKDLAAIAMSGGGAYVARVAFGADDTQTVKALLEAEAYPGPAIVIAYSPCIAHGFDLRQGLSQQKRAVDCGHWPLLRFDPSREGRGLKALQLDSAAPKISFKDYAYRETRYKMLEAADPASAERLLKLAQADVERRWRHLAGPGEGA
ncbi:MAG: putative pyruvate-flavodoxin oxidoreductase [Elusimicrobia bacterium]|nr:MAG: putative pyruvate-flavodoxin oxidoreductase [Elusimicrobiota bacterium]